MHRLSLNQITTNRWSVAEAAGIAASQDEARVPPASDQEPVLYLALPDRAEAPGRWRLYRDLAAFREAAENCCARIAAAGGPTTPPAADSACSLPLADQPPT